MQPPENKKPLPASGAGAFLVGMAVLGCIYWPETCRKIASFGWKIDQMLKAKFDERESKRGRD